MGIKVVGQLKNLASMVSLLFLFGANSAVAGSSNVTVNKVRIWQTGEIYLVLLGDNLDPAGCTAPNLPLFWILKPSSEEVKSRMYSMALTAKTAAMPIRVELDATTCSGKYPIIQMLELE